MKALLFTITVALLPTNSYAFPEIPFCPAGGPPGWMNHFNYKRDQNIWRRYSQYSPHAYNQAPYYKPNYGYAYIPDYKRPYIYPTLPYNYGQNHSQHRSAPSRNY